ncbi:hypothetical protein [Marinobacter sp.]|uniref:hypothetical protein n=1 Tax=Marinobacter sp. TaxID=50741 RepID=UPI0035647A72
MVRVGLVVLFLAVMAVAGWWLPQWLDAPSADSGADPVTTCRPLTESCRWTSDNGPAEVTLVPLSGDELQLDLILPGLNAKPLIVLTGESMYMGEYPLALSATDQPGHYRVSFVPPFCTTGDEMVWRVSVRIGGEAAELPFRILFSPSAAS